jgi:glutathione S-transferase
MKLLYTKRSPYARKVRVLALEKNLKLELVAEDLQNKSQRLLDVNPLGKIPTLILDDNSVVYDSSVICQYLDQFNERPIMVPQLGEKRLDVLKWDALADDLVAIALSVYMEKIRHPENFKVDFVAAQEASVKRTLDYIEAHLRGLKEFSLAPVAVGCALGYIQFRLPHLSPQGKLDEWFRALSQRPSMAQTVPVA